jgi:hypothetical protein
MTHARVVVRCFVMTLPGLLLPFAVVAQDISLPLEMPRAVAEQAVAFFNAPSTIRFNGRSGVPAGGSVFGNVAALGGPFTVGGRIDGDLLVLNGDLVFREGGRVSGNVTLIGGMLDARVPGDVSGTLAVYPGVLRVVDRDGEIELSARQLRSFDRAEGLGRTTFTVRAGTNYNRVEGLPVMFGPLFETAEPHSLKVEALGVWRSESGLTLGEEEFGYQLLVEQRFGSEQVLSVGGTLHSTVAPISPIGLSDVESSLATFFLRKDYRDYFEHTGWSAFVTASPPQLPLHLRLEYLDEKHRFAAVQAPWTLRRNDSSWRPQPLVAEGDLRALAAEVSLDTRNDVRDPTDGWWVRARVVQGVDGALAMPQHSALAIGDPWVFEPESVDATFNTGSLDLRRYARVGPESDVALRVLLAGSLDGGAIPPQYQYALGGLPSLPGYPLFSQDCGARSRLVTIEFEEADATYTQPAFPRYGCDRAALLQLEYRRRLELDLDIGPWEDDRLSWYPQMDLSPSWGFFFDIGQGWSSAAPELDTSMISDLGLAVFLGNLGLYTAYPLRGDDRELNFFVRFQRRF